MAFRELFELKHRLFNLVNCIEIDLPSEPSASDLKRVAELESAITKQRAVCDKMIIDYPSICPQCVENTHDAQRNEAHLNNVRDALQRVLSDMNE